MDKHIEELLLKSTSIIYTVDRLGRMSSATCFFMLNRINGEDKHYLVTNKHVLENIITAYLYLDFYNKKDNTYLYNQKITLTLGNDVHFNTIYDIAIVDVTFLNQLNSSDKTIYYATIGIGMIPNDFSIFSNIQPIIMIGYPKGIYNKTFNSPIVRSGITATPINKKHESKDEFIIDIPSIHGSSGSPIFAEINNKLYLLGIERGTYNRQITVDKFKNRLYHKSTYTFEIDTQLGIAIRSNQIFNMLVTVFGE